MNFRKFFDLAETLSQGTTEAEWRTAISRAYYAVFHVGCERLDALGFRVPRRTEQSHAYAWRRWSNSGQPRVEKCGRELNALRSDRNQADYDRNPKITARHAEDAVAKARTVLIILDEVNDEPLRSQVQAAIRAYECDVLKEVTWHG